MTDKGSTIAPAPNETGRRFRTAEHVVATQEADATILLDTRRGKYFTLNGVGSRIWALLSAGATVGDVIERLAPEFDVSADQIGGDVDSFVKQLQHSKLITP